MLNSIYKHAEIKNPKLATASVAVAAGVGAAAIDHFLGAHSNDKRRSHPIFHSARITSGQSTLGVFPGCQTNGRMFFEALKPLTPNSKLIVTDYPEHTFNVEQICENFANELLKSRAERLSLYCQSMGGIVMRHFVHYAHETGVAEKLGGIRAIILDSSPFDYDDVREGSRRWAIAASAPVIRTSRTVDFLKPHIYGRVAGKMSAGAHLDTIRSETLFMQDAHPDGALPDIMDNVYYIHGRYDHVVNTETAVPRYEAITPAGKFQEILHTDRKHGDHTAPISQLPFILAHAGVPTHELGAVA